MVSELLCKSSCISLVTADLAIGDLAPKSNPGRPFFVVWSLIAVPTMTILVSDLGDTVISKFKHGTFALADFTVLPKAGVWRHFLERHPWLLDWLMKRKERKAAQKRLEEGLPIGPEAEAEEEPPTIDQLAAEQPTRADLARKLARWINRTAHDVKDHSKKRYNYEEWVEITLLIRFTAKTEAELEIEETDEDGLVQWDWLGENSPMMARGSEAEFVLDRLCESMNRYVRHAARHNMTDEETLKRPPGPRQRTPEGDTIGVSTAGEKQDTTPHDSGHNIEDSMTHIKSGSRTSSSSGAG